MFNKWYDDFHSMPQKDQNAMCDRIGLLLWIPIILVAGLVAWNILSFIYDHVYFK